MKNVIVSVATTVDQFPAGTIPAGITIAIAGVGSQTIAAAPFEATFQVPGGTFNATAQAIDANNAPLGALLTSAPFDVPADTVAIDVPSTITVTVQ